MVEKTEDSADSTDPNEVRRLTSLYCDQALEPDQMQTLDQALRSSAGARKESLSLLQVNASLSCRERSRDDAAVALAAELHATERAGHGPFSGLLTRSPLLFKYALAACVLLAIGAMGWVLRGKPGAGNLAHNDGGSVPVVADRGADPRPAPTVVAVGEVTYMSEDCRLFVGGRQVDTAGRVRVAVHQEICLAAGAFEIVFENGVRSAVKAPAVLEPLTATSVRLIEGSFSANVGEEGIGFTVDTPHARVVDLGTAFGISASKIAGTQVVVFDGEVDVSPLGSRPVRPMKPSTRLKVGEGIQLLANGSIGPLMSFASTEYVIPGRARTSPNQRFVGSETSGVISSVSDSLNRFPGSYYHYEIVHQGMNEDALAYADRVYHEWNGVEKTGMPRYLVGGDYVKVINNVREIDDFTMYVTLNQPATLYVMIDDRATVPQWLVDDFVDTGDDIGLDEGPHIFENGWVLKRDMPAVGPGVSIDQQHSIWKREVLSPATIELGRMGKAPTGEACVMYGVVATPLNLQGNVTVVD